MRQKRPALPRTLKEAVIYFERSNNSEKLVASLKWPKGACCPICGSDQIYLDSSARRWECKTRHLRRSFTLKSGTIFEDSAVPLSKWLIAIWMVANDTHFNSRALARTIGVTQKTAWLMLLKIRLASNSTGVVTEPE
jgi:transposase-like protein